MSARARIEDAQLLWKHGRREGAWVLTLVAAAATSRKRYPRGRDNEAFKRFIRDVSGTLVTGKSGSEVANPRIVFDKTPLEDIVYEHLRCNLLHEGEIAAEIAFSESRVVNGKLEATLAVGSPNRIPDFWVHNLMAAIREAPENAAEFGT